MLLLDIDLLSSAGFYSLHMEKERFNRHFPSETAVNSSAVKRSWEVNGVKAGKSVVCIASLDWRSQVTWGVNLQMFLCVREDVPAIKGQGYTLGGLGLTSGFAIDFSHDTRQVFHSGGPFPSSLSAKWEC